MQKVARSHVSPHFEKQFEGLPKKLQRLVAKKLLLFENNPYHPGMNTHKLKGPLSGFWAFYVNYRYRILFRFLENNTVIYYDIDTHDIYK